MKKVAILLTSFNREQKTDICLSSLIEALKNVHNYIFDIYVVDDNSADGTAKMITEKYPLIKLILGDGFLFWAGGMRLAWKTALNSINIYDGFLLVNDDVCFFDTFWNTIYETIQYAESQYSKQGIYVVSTIDRDTHKLSYGGHLLKNKLFKHSFCQVVPKDEPQECDLTNANILFVSKNVVESIGILDTHFTHSLADFDYSLTAKRNGFPVLVAPGIGGYCTNDHFEDSLSSKFSLKGRIKNLYGVKGIALNEYLYYLNKHFHFKALYAFIVLWLRTLFPKFIPVK